MKKLILKKEEFIKRYGHIEYEMTKELAFCGDRRLMCIWRKILKISRTTLWRWLQEVKK